MSDSLKVAYYYAQVVGGGTPSCPCAASKCCYLGVACVTP